MRCMNKKDLHKIACALDTVMLEKIALQEIQDYKIEVRNNNIDITLFKRAVIDHIKLNLVITRDKIKFE